MMMKKILIAIIGAVMIMTSSAGMAAAGGKEVTMMTMPFGTPFYMIDSAVEAFFTELGDKSPVNLKLKQTPGAMYIVKSLLKNQEAMKSGKTPYSVQQALASIVPYMREGRWPFEKAPLEGLRAISGGVFVVNTFVTFDKDIKTPADLAGKKVGFAEKARVFQSILPNKPYFEKAYGGFDKVKWQYLGSNNSKDALLNGSIDAAWVSLSAKVSVNDAGEIVCEMAVPSPPLLELLSAGKELYFVNEDAATIKKASDPATDYILHPVLIKKGSVKGLDHDVTARGVIMCMTALEHMSEDDVASIVTTIYSNLDRLISFNKVFALYPKNPYPIGLDPKHAHPGLLKALKNMNMEIPKLSEK
jgi:TRAP-type uncharacterized transport system substrate-binding protein